MSRLGDKSYGTCAPGCGCVEYLDLENTGSFFMPENEDDDDE